VGGGISGLTTALRLSQRGYKVTVYEQKPFLGGNLAAHKHPDTGVYHDVYPHMFSNFYVNFWNLVENDLGMRRNMSAKSDFAHRNTVKVLRWNQEHSMELKDAGSLEGLRSNLFSGWACRKPTRPTG
jgi:phytoene dehydrogenase-like protein